MEEQFARFPHISEKIFGQLNNQNLAKCRNISKSWCNYLANQKFMNIRIIKQSIRSSDCKDDFHWLIDETKKPWTEFFKRASAESFQYFAKVSRKVLPDLSKSELQPFLMCGECTSALTAYQNFQSIFEPLDGYGNRISAMDMYLLKSDSDSDFEKPDSAEKYQNIYEDFQNADRDRYLSCNLGCGATPLHLIAMTGHLETFKETYDNANDKNPNVTEKGRTFLHFAIRFCNKEICMYILEKTYNEIRKNVDGLSTLDIASLFITMDVSWMYLEVIFKEIVEKNPGSRGVTPIQLADIRGHLKRSEMILDKVVNKTSYVSTKKYNEELLDALKLF